MKTTFESMCGFCPRQYELTVSKPLYKYTAETAPSGVLPLSNHGGVAIWLVDGYGDECIAAYNFGGGIDKARRHCIHVSDSGREYIRKEGVRYYLDEFRRVS